MNRLMKLDEVAEYLHVSMSTVRRLIQEGELRIVRIGRVIRVRPEDLNDYIKRSAVDPSDAGDIRDDE